MIPYSFADGRHCVDGGHWIDGVRRVDGKHRADGSRHQLQIQDLTSNNSSKMFPAANNSWKIPTTNNSWKIPAANKYKKRWVGSDQPGHFAEQPNTSSTAQGFFD